MEYSGTTGTAQWLSFTSDDLRVRMFDYGARYLADHWCDRGHVLHVISGELVFELADGRTLPLAQGTSSCVSDHGDAARRLRASARCHVFFVD